MAWREGFGLGEKGASRNRSNGEVERAVEVIEQGHPRATAVAGQRVTLRLPRERIVDAGGSGVGEEVEPPVVA
jgi:hypothetical protein